jgi:PAS domain S-box-containing protein
MTERPKPSMQNFFPFRRESNPWSRLPVSYRGAIVIAIPALCLVATLIAWIWSRQAGLEQARQIQQKEAIIMESDRVLILLLDAETGIRGYDLSGDRTFLEPYQFSVAKLPGAIASLQKLTRDDSQQAQQAKAIAKLVQNQTQVLAQRLRSLEMQNPKKIQSQYNQTSLEGAKTSMDRIRAALNRLERQAQTQLESQQKEHQRIENTTTAIQWLAVFAGVIAYPAAVYLFVQLDRELKEREVQLVESKEFVEAITSNMVDGVITLNKDHQIATINPAAIVMFGYSAEEMLGKHWTMWLIEPSLSDLEKEVQFRHWQERFTYGELFWQATGYCKQGDAFPIEIAIAKMNLDDSWIAIIRDTSEREEAAERLSARAEELSYLGAVLAKTNLALQRQNQELDRFAYVASHDLKAPLRAIANLSVWLEEDLESKLTPEGERMMHLLRGRVHRLEALIDALLAYSRIGRFHSVPEETDVTLLLQEIVNYLAPPPRFTIEIDVKIPVLVTKKQLLREVFLNLIKNAIEHNNNDDAWVKISVRDFDEYYEFAIADNGPGIAPEFHQKIFTIFQTLQARDVVEKTGIGLSLVKKILEVEGGTIRVESQLGKGATFYFTWHKAIAR